MQQKNLKKQSDSQFVCKLCDMIENYPNIINWNQDGQIMIIFDIQQMEKLVLPQYFRHSNFPSFIRQLNMYNFHKILKEGNEIHFQNDIFKRGNQKNFHFIHRKKKIKEQEMASKQFKAKNYHILQKINKQSKINEKTKQTLEILIEHKYTVFENIKVMKIQIQKVHRQLKDCRSKKISEALKQIKNKTMEELNELTKKSKQIDKFLETQFLILKENKQLFKQKQNKQIFSNQINSQYYLPIFDCNKFRPKPSFMVLPSHHCGFFSANDGNASHPMFFSGPRIASQMYYGQQVEDGVRTITKQEELEQQDSMSNSMDVVGEDQLKRILQENQNGKLDDIKTENVLKNEAQ